MSLQYSQKMLESKLQRDIRLHLGQKPDLVIWRQNVGRVFNEESQNWIQYGLCPGSSDLIGILTVVLDDIPAYTTGRFFAAELKAQSRLRKEQQLFIDLVNKMGGYGCVLRSVDDAELHYQRARQGLAPP